MATTPRKNAGTTRKARTATGKVSPKERTRRQRQSTEATGTGNADEMREAIREAAAEGERRRRDGTVGAEEIVTAKELRERAQGELIRMPSGLVARCRRIGMLALLQAGVIPNSLMPIVEYALTTAASGRTVKEGDITSKIDATMLPDMMATFDLVASYIVVQPRLRPNPRKCPCGALEGMTDHVSEFSGKHEFHDLPENDWPETHPVTGEELAYVAWVPDEDKQFLFNFAVGGSRDIDRFRADQQAYAVEPV